MGKICVGSELLLHTEQNGAGLFKGAQILKPHNLKKQTNKQTDKVEKWSPLGFLHFPNIPNSPNYPFRQLNKVFFTC